ncbi:MAG: SAM-dependent methyltransferase [Thiotrichales bacterium]|nr:SAM-dependent methyltransferase [Thiotrichales bacterium]OUX52333.1 MAG: SAM-dependent methyltransferase [Methylococcaceae bacterium TMED282]
MNKELEVSTHYQHGSLIKVIEEGFNRQGKAPPDISLDDMSVIDEFHIGGRQASEEFLDQLRLQERSLVLDVGCGLGGPARFVASQFGCLVSGIDLTHEYVDTGNVLSNWVGLDKKVILQQGSATALPFPDGQFDAAYMMHVGMNIADKKSLFVEVFKVLKPDGIFGIYDVMQVGSGEMQYPAPWAASKNTSSLASPQGYQTGLKEAGFNILATRERGDFAVEFFENMKRRMAETTADPALGLHVLMGGDAKTKVANVLTSIKAGSIAPVEIIAQR